MRCQIGLYVDRECAADAQVEVTMRAVDSQTKQTLNELPARLCARCARELALEVAGRIEARSPAWDYAVETDEPICPVCHRLRFSAGMDSCEDACRPAICEGWVPREEA